MANSARHNLAALVALFGLVIIPTTAQKNVCHTSLTGRYDCGTSSSTEASCTAAGCCWSPVTDYIWCFHPLTTVRATIQTDCSGPDLATTVDVAIVFDTMGSTANEQVYLNSVTAASTMISDHATYTPDLVRPSIAGYASTYTVHLPFRNNAVRHEGQAWDALQELMDEDTTTKADLVVGLQAILHLYTDTAAFPRPGAPRVAALYITSANIINKPVAATLMAVLKSHNIAVMIFDYSGIAGQIADLQSLVPSDMYFTPAGGTALHTAICNTVKTGMVIEQARNASLEVKTVTFGGVYFRMNEDAAKTLVLLAPFTQAGFIRSVRLDSSTLGHFYLLLHRTIGTKTYLVKKIKLDIRVEGIQRIKMKGLKVRVGDRLALYSKDTKLPVPYDACSSKAFNTLVITGLTQLVDIGQEVDLTNAINLCRDYSLQVNLATEYAMWTTTGSRSIKQSSKTTVLELYSVMSLEDCGDMCIDHDSFDCKAIEYANDGSNVCRLLSTKYVSGSSEWDDAVFSFDYAEWSAVGVADPVLSTSSNVGRLSVIFDAAKPRLSFDAEILIFRDLKFTFNTRVSQWKVLADRAGTVYICVWRWMAKYAAYSLIAKQKVIFTGPGIHQISSSGRVHVHRGDVIGLASVGGGVGQMVKIGAPMNQNEASTIYTAHGNMAALRRGDTVVGVLSTDRGLPAIELVSAADATSTSRQVAGAALYMVTYSQSKSAIRDSVTGRQAAVLNVFKAKDAGNADLKYIRVELTSRDILLTAGDKGTLVFQFQPKLEGIFINTIMEMYIGQTTSLLCSMSVRRAGSLYQVSIQYYDFTGSHVSAAHSTSGQMPNWFTFTVVTGSKGSASKIFVNGVSLSVDSSTVAFSNVFKDRVSTSSMGELVAATMSFEHELQLTDIMQLQELETPFLILPTLPIVSMTMSSSGVPTYSSSISLVAGKRVTYKVFWRDVTTLEVLYSEVVIIKPRKGQETHKFVLSPTAKVAELRTNGIRIEVQTCEPVDCEASLSGAHVSMPLNRDFTVLNSDGVIIENFPTTLTLDEGSSVTYKVRLHAPAHQFCAESATSCIVRLQTIVSQVQGTARVKCPLIVASIPQLAISGWQRDADTCRLLFTENADGIYELDVTIDAFPDGITKETQNTAKHRVTVSLLVNDQVFKPVFTTQVSITDNTMWPSPCMVRQFGEILHFSSTRDYVLSDGEFNIYENVDSTGARPVERVHMFFRKFSTSHSAPTACAAFIQAGDDVLSMDTCGPTIAGQANYPPTIKLYQHGILTPGFSILRARNGWEYNIIFPSLTKIHLSMAKHLTVTIISTASTTASITGLCKSGSATANTRTTFSMAYGMPPAADPKPLGQRFSRCESVTDGSVESISGLGCDLTFASDKTQKLEPTACAKVPKQERADCGYSGISEGQCNANGCCWDNQTPGVKWCFNSPADPIMLYGSFFKPDLFEYQPNGQTYKTADNIYQAVISGGGTPSDASITSKCSGINTGALYLTALQALPTSDMCKRDVKATGELDTAYSTSMELRQLAMTIIYSQYDGHYMDSDPPGEKMIVETFLTLVGDNCASSCSGHGGCVRSACECTGNRGGVDCSSTGNTPVVREVTPFRSCDRAKSDCSQAFFNGNNFKVGKTFYSLTGTVSQQNLKAVYMTATNFGVHIPSSQTGQVFNVVFQVNGKTSVPYKYVVYNSRCQTVTNSGNLQSKTDICTIASRCYSSGTINPEKRQERCIPSVSMSAWTTVADVEPPVFTASLNEGLWKKGSVVLQNLGISIHPQNSQPTFVTDPHHASYKVLLLGRAGGARTLTVALKQDVRSAGSFTLLLQVRPNAKQAHDSFDLLKFSSPGQPTGLSIRVEKGVTLVASQASMGGNRLKGRLTLGAWNVIGLVYNALSQEVALYINNVQAGSSVSVGAIGPDINHVTLTIGDAVTPFQGSVFGLRMFAEPLSRATLAVEAAATPSRYPAPPSPVPSVTYSSTLGYQLSVSPATSQMMLVTWLVNGTQRGTTKTVRTATVLTLSGKQPTLGFEGQVSVKIQTCHLNNDCNTPVESVLSNDLMFNVMSTSTFRGSLVVSGLEGLPLYTVRLARGGSVVVPVTLAVSSVGLCASTDCVIGVVAYRIPGEEPAPTCLDNSEAIPQLYVDSPSSGAQCGAPVSVTGGASLRLYAARQPVISDRGRTVLLAIAVTITEGGATTRRPIAMCEVIIEKPAPTERDTMPVCELVRGRHVFTYDKEVLSIKSEGSWKMYAHGDLEEVQTHHRRCSPGSPALCVCGVTVRYKDTVFTMTRGCGLENPSFAPVISQIYSTSSSADLKVKVVTQSGDLYSVLLPGGTHVDLKIEAQTISVSIYARKDIDSDSRYPISGYCGTADNIPGSVSLNLQDNKVPVGDNQLQGCARYSAATTPPNLCDCNGQNGLDAVQPSCGLDDPLPCITGTDITAKIHYHRQAGTCFTKLPFKYSTTFVSYSDITDVDINTDIRTIIQRSAVYRAYISLSITGKISLENLVLLAVAERELSGMGGGTRLSLSAAARLALLLVQGEVEAHGRTVVSQQVTDPLSGLTTSLLLTTLCPNDCSGNGFCLAGTCLCGPQYRGKDCSFQHRAWPLLLLINEPQCCDGVTSDCDQIDMVGEGFEDLKTLTCYVKLNTISGNSERTVPAKFVSTRHVICPLATGGYSFLEITVSNDGKAYNPDHVTVYLPGHVPACLTCGPPGVHLQKHHCLIDRKCYENFDENVDKKGQECYDYLSKIEWSTFTDKCRQLAEKDRLDCGFPDGTATSCIVGNVCCHSVAPGFPSCYFRAGVKPLHIADHPMCDNNPNTVACPDVGMLARRSLCNYKGCCFVDGNGCYKYTGPERRTPEPDGCPSTDYPMLVRVPCSSTPINEEYSCHRMGCCFKKSSTEPSCYKIPPPANRPGSCPATADLSHARTACGSTAVSETVCYRMGCCYDRAISQPDCYKIPECFPDLKVKELNFKTISKVVIFADLLTTCTGYMGSLSLFAVYTGKIWVDLYERTDDKYTLRHSLQVTVGVGGVFHFTPATSLLLPAGMVLGVRVANANDRVLVSFAASGQAGFDATGYATADLSRVVALDASPPGLVIGGKLTHSLQPGMLQLPAIKLNVVPIAHRCAQLPADRRICGHPGITRQACLNIKNVKGPLCCFETSSIGIQCFFSAEASPYLRPDSCPATDTGLARNSCGTDQTNEELCSALGCCFNPSQGKPSCYTPPNIPMPQRCLATAPQNQARNACGSPSIDRIGCYLRGCCYTESKGSPSCYEAKDGAPPTPDRPGTPVPVVGGPDSPVPPGPTRLPTGIMASMGTIEAGTNMVVTWKVDGVVVKRRVFQKGTTHTYLELQGLHKVDENAEVKICMYCTYKDSLKKSTEVCSFPWRPVNVTVASGSLTVAEGQTQLVTYSVQGYPGLLCGAGKTTGFQLQASLVGNSAPKRSCGPTLNDVQQVAFSHYKNRLAQACYEDFSVSNEMLVNVTSEVRMTGFLDNRVDGNEAVTVNFRLAKNIGGTVVCTVNAGEFQVVVSDTTPKNSRCIVGYPFDVQQFNGRTLSSNLEGTFVMYRHPALPIEVHIVTKAVTASRSPGAQFAVVCAAAVRAGNDVIMFSMCGSEPNQLGSTLVIKSKISDPLYPGMLVYKRQEDNIVVMLPHGGALFLNTGEIGNLPFFNAIYSPSRLDFHVMAGVCGAYEQAVYSGPVLTTAQGNNAINAQRVSPNWNIFRQPAVTVDRAVSLCNCEGTLRGVNCRNRPYERCDTSLNEITTASLLLNRVNDVIVRAWSDANRRDPVGIVVPRFPAPNGFTEPQARAFCTGVVYDTDRARLCSGMIPATYSHAETLCVELIGRTGQTEMVAVISQKLKGVCLQALSQLTKIPGNNSISGSVCINNCGDHGYCNFGSCQCQSGYTGNSCTRPPHARLLVTGIVGGNKCLPSQDRPCNMAILTGTFNPMINYTCKVTYIEPLSRKVRYVSTYPASQVMFGRLTCPLPGGESCIVSVQDNAARISSQRLPYLVVDPSCMSCVVQPSHDYSCWQMKHGCLIHGRCRPANTLFSEEHSCFYCDPERNANDWSKKDMPKCANKALELEDKVLGPHTLLILVFATIVLGIIFITVCLCMYRRARVLSNRSLLDSTDSEYSSESGSVYGLSTSRPGSVIGRKSWGVYALRDQQQWGYANK